MSVSSWWRGIRQHGREVAEDLGAARRRAPGMWGARVTAAMRAGAQRGREIVSHAPEQARKAGQLLAAKVIGVQRSARLPEHLVERSARSAIAPRRDGPEPAGEWREGYRQVAEARIPGLAPAASAAPSWPDRPARNDPDLEAGR